MTEADAVPLRCSTYARMMGIDPVGTAGSYDAYLLAELPLPWPHDIGELPGARALEEAAARLLPGRAVRIQAVTPARPAERSRLALYAADGRGGYRGREIDHLPDELVEAAEALVGGHGRPVQGREILICTHGRRDVCCGSRGIELFQQMAGMRGPHHQAVRWLRTSHTGGHRFAPTALALPEGQLWAYLDADTLDAIVGRAGPVPTGHYRGATALAHPAVQAVERAAFAAHGWSWLNIARTGAIEETVGDRTVAVVDFDGGPGQRGRYRGVVRVVRTLPVPDCGQPLEAARKQADELVVESVEHEVAV